MLSSSDRSIVRSVGASDESRRIGEHAHERLVRIGTCSVAIARQDARRHLDA